jgi:hypothetical protein
MSVKKFKFVSPGVFLSEIDKSQLPKLPGGVGPVIIGRTQRGPAMKPVKVSSFQEFTEIFGEPLPGGGTPSGDVWRDGNGHIAPTYGAYAAQAYLKAEINSPVTFIRLAGIAGDDAGDAGSAGWAAARAYGIWGTNIDPDVDTAVASFLLGIIYAPGTAFKVGTGGIKFNHATDVATNGNFYDAFVDPDPTQIPVKIDASNHSFDIVFSLAEGAHTTKKVSFRHPSGEIGGNFIRDALNTNPIITNAGLTGGTGIPDLAEHYWLGETFEEEYEKLLKSKVADENTCVFITRLNDLMADRKGRQHELRHSSTPWVIPQYKGTFNSDAADLSTSERLFRVHSIQEGEQSLELMVEIQNIKIAEPSAISPYSRFDVVVKRALNDTIYAVDSYENLNLNPNSEDYIANRIGDQYFKWDGIQKRNRLYGDYANQSSYIRIEMNPVFSGKGPGDKAAAPFGFLGPVIPSSDPGTVNAFLLKHAASSTWSMDNSDANIGVDFEALVTSLEFHWPSPPTVLTGALNAARDYVFGATAFDHNRTTDASTKYAEDFSSVNSGLKDYYRILADYSSLTEQQQAGIKGGATKHAYVFSLDDIVITGVEDPGADLSNYTPELVQWISGSSQLTGSAATASYTAKETAEGIKHSAAALLDLVNSFTLPMIGGCDGVNIVEADPFNMSVRANCLGPDATTANSYAYASVDRAIEMIRNPEAVEMKLAAMPGITNKNLTAKLIQICEARADALAIIDLPNVFKPEHEAFAENFEARVTGTSASKSAKDLIRRRINSSYGCAYYPWVQIRDTIDGSPVWVPPSVLALGTMAYTEQRDEVWFAPAGFNRGGLNEGNAGLPVLQVSEQLLSKDRDILYDANINPIASFVSEGIVIFGQKTLQSTKSALDRINVRRLLIFVKREVSRVSNTLLFDNNLPATWNRFKSLVVPMLESVKTRLGLADFKVVLDETTTTSDLVDRNVMYAKIFLKPARAIEFIAVDFVITRSGASFK